MSTRRRLQRLLANGYRNWRYGTREQPSSHFGVLAAFLLPRQRALMDSEFRHLPRPSSGDRVLDIGCGDGAFLERAVAAGWNGLGVDFDPDAVANARSRGLNVHWGTIDAIAEPDVSFDAITISHVIEHVHDPVDLVRRTHALLKPGGLLWIDTPNIESVGRRFFGEAWLGLDPPRHLVLFRPSSLRTVLESNGFRIVKRPSRFEVCASVFAASHRIATQRDPLGNDPVPLRVRMRAQVASWSARMNPDKAEFTTLVAQRQS